MAALFAWQALTVRFNYNGNWTALYQMGDLTPLPEPLQHGGYFWTHHPGYEGEEARVVAHDPFNRQGWAIYLDDAEMRYTRWLMPVTAYALALGRPERIDRAYLASFLLFSGLGTFALVFEFGLAGLIFAVLPATLISMDRLTVNVSLAALAALAVVTWRRKAWFLFAPALALAPLAHPQGWTLTAAAFLASLRWKRPSGMILAAACAVPGLLVLAAAQRTVPSERILIDAFFDWATVWAAAASLEAWVRVVFSRFTHFGGPPLIVIMQLLDAATLAALAFIGLWTIRRFRARSGRLERWAAMLCVIPGALVDAEHHLAEPFMWLNQATPLLLLHWIDTPCHLRAVRWAPVAICSIRVGYQFGYQVLGVLQGLLG